MSWRKNRRKKREEPETASLTPEEQRDVEYLSLIDSYHSTRKELKLAAKCLRNVRPLHDQESEDCFRQKVRGLRDEYTSIKDKLGLNGPAEFVIKYNDSGITGIEGTARDWTVANYHLTKELDKDAKERGISITSESKKENPTWVSGYLKELKRNAVYCVIKTETWTYLTPDRLSFGFNPHYEFKDESYRSGSGYITGWTIELNKKDAIKFVGRLMENPTYKNKIQITARRSEG